MPYFRYNEIWNTSDYQIMADEINKICEEIEIKYDLIPDETDETE